MARGSFKYKIISKVKWFMSTYNVFQEKKNISSISGKGVLYIAFGKKYLDEVVLSIFFLRKNNPEIEVHVLCDDARYFDKTLKSFFPNTGAITSTEVKPTHIRAKVDYISLSPFEKTLYLDSDTLPIYDIGEIFDALDFIDLCICHDFSRKRVNFSEGIPKYGELSRALPEVNGGVFAYNKNPKTQKFLDAWRSNFYKYFDITNGWDQPSLRISLYESDVRFSILPDEYNTRPSKTLHKNLNATEIVGSQYLKSKILHFHVDENALNEFVSGKSLDAIKEEIAHADLVWPLGVQNDFDL
jgi:hypothetical protein